MQMIAQFFREIKGPTIVVALTIILAIVDYFIPYGIQNAQSTERLKLCLSFLEFISLCFGLLAGIGVTIWAVFHTFQGKSRSMQLFRIVSTYFALIFLYSVIFYCLDAVYDYNDRADEYFYYSARYNNEKTDHNPHGEPIILKRVSQRAFSGISADLWSGLEDQIRWHHDPYLSEAEELPVDVLTDAAGKVPDVMAILHFKPENRAAVFSDCLHLSVMTMTTVGYGNVSPVDWLPKRLCELEVLSGLILLVLSLGMLLSSFVVDTDPKKNKNPALSVGAAPKEDKYGGPAMSGPS